MVQRAYDLPITGPKIAEMLDGGQYRRAEKLLTNIDVSSDPMLAILRADVEIYFARLDSGARLIAQVRGNLAELSLPVAARYAQTQGGLHYWRLEEAQAGDEFLTAQQIYRLLEDPFHVANSLCGLARLKRRRGDFQEAEELLSKARELIKDEGPEQIERFEFLSGLIDLNQGACRQQAGDLEHAGTFFTSAIELLRRSEEGRYFAGALSSYGSLLVRLGRYQEALQPLQASGRILAELTILDELSDSRRNLACAMIRIRQYAEAEELLKEGIELARRIENAGHLTMCLELLAELYFEKGDLEAARRHVQSAMEHADLGESGDRKSNIRTLAGRIALARGDIGTAERELTRALEIAETIPNGVPKARAYLYLAETCLATSTVKGREYLSRAAELLAQYHDASLEVDLKRIGSRYRGERITVTADNRLTINGNLLPTWNAAKEAVERFILKNAIDQAGGNQAKAGEILGISKVHVHDKRKQYGL